MESIHRRYKRCKCPQMASTPIRILQPGFSAQAQKVLQFQAPWKLCATLPTRAFSGRFAGAGVSMDWTGVPLLLELSLLERLERRCSHSRKELWQRSQARCKIPSGWNLASSSRRTWFAECCQQ